MIRCVTCVEDESGEGHGRNARGKCPDELDLVTGIPDDARATLRPDDEHWELFLSAWREQGGWSHREHELFWRAGFHLWPRARSGRQPVRERHAHALRVCRHHGLSDAEAAAVLGVQLDTLRRRVAEHAKRLEMVTVTDYLLPRVYAGHEPAPNPNASKNLALDVLGQTDPRTEQIAALLEPVRRRPLDVDAVLADLDRGD